MNVIDRNSMIVMLLMAGVVSFCGAEAGPKVPGPVTTVETHRGKPTFMIDGQPLTRPVFETYVPETKYFKEFQAAGCKVYSFSTNLGDGFGPPTWVGTDQWDFTELDARVHRVLEADPNALILPRILMSTPLWLLDQHPDYCQVLDNGSLFYTKNNSCSLVNTSRKFESIASPGWRKDMGQALGHLVEHMQNSDYGDHMFGYMVTGLMSEEWYHNGAGGDELGDYNPA